MRWLSRSSSKLKSSKSVKLKPRCRPALELLEDRVNPDGQLLPIRGSAHVFDDLRHVIYASHNNAIERYDYVTQQVLPAWTIGGTNLQGLDITSDYRYLVVTDSGSGTVYKVDLANGAVAATMTGPANGFDVVMLTNTKGFVSFINFGTTVYDIDLATDSLTPRNDPLLQNAYQVAMERSADRSKVVFTGTSTPTLYNTATDTFTSAGNYSRFVGSDGRYLAANRNGIQFAVQPDYQTLNVFDSQFSGIESKWATSEVGLAKYIGMVFDPVRDVFYTANPDTNMIDAFETSSWKRIYSIPIGYNLTANIFIGPFGTGFTSISADGKYLAFSGDGLRLFNLLDNAVAPVTRISIDNISDGQSSYMRPKVGEAVGIQVSARNANNDVAINFNGTVHFTSTDPGAMLPADYTFTPADQGRHEFPVRFSSVGEFTVTVQYVSQPALNATSAKIPTHVQPLTVLTGMFNYDMVYDPLRNMAYFVSASWYPNWDNYLVYRYDIAHDTMLEPLVINGGGGDMEISGDGRYLFIGAQSNLTQNSIKRVELDTGKEAMLWYTSTEAAFRLKRLSDNSILMIRQDVYQRDGTMLLSIAPDGSKVVNSYFSIPSFTMPGYIEGQFIEVSPDGSTILFADLRHEYTPSSDTYTIDTYLLHTGVSQPVSSFSGFASVQGPSPINRSNDRMVITGRLPNTYTPDVRMFDDAFNILQDPWPLSSTHSYLPAVADPVRDWIHTWRSISGIGYVDTILNVVDGSVVADIPIQTTYFETPSYVGEGQFLITSDGSKLFVNVGHGKTRIIDLPAYLPTLASIGGGQANEGNTGTRTLDFTISLSQAKSNAQEVRFQTQDGTALAGIDYVPLTGSVIFQPGETQKIVSVALIGDSLHEANETFSLKLTKALGEIQISTDTATGTILDDDAPPVAQIVMSPTQGPEGVLTSSFTVSLSEVAGVPVTLQYNTSGTAANGSDYLLQTGTITFAPGETSKTFTLSIINDSQIEPNETVMVTLSNPSHATLGQASATYTIIDDDQLPTVQFVDSASQGLESGAQVFIPIKLSIPYVYPVTVKYSAIGGTAQAGVDYTLPEGQITFAPGETTKTVPVTIINDILSETNESIIIYVQPVTNALYGQQSVHVYTILDDDPPVVGFASSNSSGVEGSSSDVIVYLSKIWTQPVTVNLSLAGGSALLGTDYAINLGPLTFTPGETTKAISLSTINDALDELDESAVLELSQPVNASLGQGTFTYTIIDDDPSPRVGFERQSSSGSEATSSALFTVLLSEASSLPVTVNYASTGGSAASGIDYVPLSGSITFAPGETSKAISLTVTNDQLFEPNETVVISLTGALNASVSGNLTHTYTIADDDAVKVAFDLDAAQGIESNLAPVIWVRLAAPLTTTAQVNYSVTGETATRGPDFTLNNGTLIFAPGQTALAIPLKIINDVLDEDNETIKIELTSPMGGIVLGDKTLYTYTVLDNDVSPSVSFSTSSGSLVEATANATVTVKLSTASGRGVDINVTRTGGTTTPDADYVFSQGSVHFNPGEVSKTFAIKVLQDALDENDETLILALNSNVNAQLGSLTKYTLTIKDDDAAPKVGFALANSTVIENAGYIDIVVQLSAPSGKAVTVKLSAGAGSTALVNKDYQPFAGTLIFNAGETQKTLRLTLVNDAVKEQNKLLKILLSSPANATLGAITQHVLTLADDD